MTADKLVKSPTPGLAEVLEGLKTVAECVRDIQKEKTEQVRIQMTAQVDVERIRANRDVLLDYLDRSFDERKENFRQLFARLDTAIASNNTELTGAVLDSVLKLADSSPFKALRDVAATREALSEKGKEWQF
ncbi:hypothetical protein [Myxococcus virescens]|uniref:Uncharacterized protein n=1 Tax=Myxococcus virescens TaxID=83456 RepID=A0A511HI74_9BACT|nr:hypothetical protein [Myxococcus virescens]GEL73272.1 hypothetical protein MVI01_50560 [Myxococcus virescens]SDE56856.1 hypothetical protein SAMN04488504_108289 [Myxococcus virescens]